jgi:hypothetical protein
MIIEMNTAAVHEPKFDIAGSHENAKNTAPKLSARVIAL